MAIVLLTRSLHDDQNPPLLSLLPQSPAQSSRDLPLRPPSPAFHPSPHLNNRLLQVIIHSTRVFPTVPLSHRMVRKVQLLPTGPTPVSPTPFPQNHPSLSRLDSREDQVQPLRLLLHLQASRKLSLRHPRVPKVLKISRHPRQ
jgi:hypothetical protein